MTRHRSWIPIACGLLLVAACEGSGDAGENDAGFSSDIALVDGYPAGPYGVVEGETIDDLGFYDPLTEQTVRLKQWFRDPKARLLMLVSTAAW